MSQYVWETSKNLIPYEEAIAKMENYVNDLHTGKVEEKIWLLEHPDIYTAGVSAKMDDMLDTNIPVIQTGRGGKITYHGPKMRIAYVMLNLKKRNSCDIRKYISNLEQVIINSLSRLNIAGERRVGRIGIWVKTGKNTEDKIAAIGVRVRKWITFHGLSVNINPDLDKFKNIIPCGIDNPNYGVTSINKLGVKITMEEFDRIMQDEFGKIFSY